MRDKCYNCPDVKYRQCPAPKIIVNGKFCCEQEEETDIAVCDKCGDRLRLGHFAYETRWKEFWCEDCLRELLESVD